MSHDAAQSAAPPGSDQPAPCAPPEKKCAASHPRDEHHCAILSGFRCEKFHACPASCSATVRRSVALSPGRTYSVVVPLGAVRPSRPARPPAQFACHPHGHTTAKRIEGQSVGGGGAAVIGVMTGGFGTGGFGCGGFGFATRFAP